MCPPGGFLLVLSLWLPVFAQDRLATIQVEVRTGSTPIPGAKVVVNGISRQTDRNGIAVIAAAAGKVEVLATKAGFFDATATITIDQTREWRLVIELQPQKTEEQQITVYATRTDTRLQDLPTRVEVLDREEIEEKMLMT